MSAPKQEPLWKDLIHVCILAGIFVGIPLAAPILIGLAILGSALLAYATLAVVAVSLLVIGVKRIFIA